MKQYLAREDLSDPSAEEAIIGRGHGLGGGGSNKLPGPNVASSAGKTNLSTPGGGGLESKSYG